MPTKLVVPESEQEPNESRRCAIIITVGNTLSGSAGLTILYSCRLWSKLTAAIRKNDMEAATQSKAAVEDAQREAVKQREESGEVWVPRYFELRDGLWQAKFQLVLALKIASLVEPNLIRDTDCQKQQKNKSTLSRTGSGPKVAHVLRYVRCHLSPFGSYSH